ncbi:MAG: 3'-5' exonuclease [Treponema sp.]|jgi:DNA polymerase III epsilon subunit family exonuclease|nr:3'-5' exonuclease [Treponema sp.]
MPQTRFLKDFRKLNRLLQDGSVFTAFDTETTGLHPESCRIIEIGAVKFNRDGILGTYGRLIKPGKPIPAEISGICHIDDEMVAAAPTAAEVLPEFLDFIQGTVLVAHNANFDIGFLNAELVRNGHRELNAHCIDTLELSRWAYPRLGKYSQPFLAAALHITIQTAHRAEDDARVCREIFLRCIRDTASIQELF